MVHIYSTSWPSTSYELSGIYATSFYRDAGPVRPFNQTAVTVWGLGLAMGCVLFGAVLLWSRVETTGVSLKGPSRVIEPSSNVIKRERIAALLLEKSRPRKDSED